MRLQQTYLRGVANRGCVTLNPPSRGADRFVSREFGVAASWGSVLEEGGGFASPANLPLGRGKQRLRHTKHQKPLQVGQCDAEDKTQVSAAETIPF